MHYYRLTIQYDGSGYAGFQWQTGLPTIQDEINKAIGQLVTGKHSSVGASRTDTGVHAAIQVVKVTTESLIDDARALEKLNRILPAQIKCLELVPCRGDFNPSIEAISKEYRYLFTNKSQDADFGRRFVANVAYNLNLEAMKVCAAKLVGVHDFCNFYSMGSNVKKTVREVFVCELSEVNPHDLFSEADLFRFSNDLHRCYQLRIEANGFLKQMIRHIVRALWMVGSARITVEEFSALLDAPKVSKQLWKVAPPQGLFLYRINYETMEK